MNGERDDRFEGGGGVTGSGSFVLSVWITIAGLALLFAVVALVYGDPVREAVEQAPRRQVAGGGATLLLSTPAEAGSVATPSSGRSDMVGGTGRDAEILAELARVSTDNKALRNGVELLRGQVDSLSERLAKMESRFSEMTGSIGVPSPIVPTGRTLAPAAPAIDIGSTAATDAKRGESNATYTQFGMELGSYSDLTTLRRAWSDLVRQYPALFEGLDGLATIRDRDGKAELLLVAGPFRNAADAAEHCGKVEAAGVKCLPAFYLGQQLSVH